MHNAFIQFKLAGAQRKKGIAQNYYYELSPTDAKTHWWYGNVSHIVILISRWCVYSIV